MLKCIFLKILKYVIKKIQIMLLVSKLFLSNGYKSLKI